jgi:hypothetical protein
MERALAWLEDDPRWGVPEPALDHLTGALGTPEKSDSPERARDVQDVLREAFEQLSEPGVAYLLRRIDALAWRVAIVPTMLSGPRFPRDERLALRTFEVASNRGAKIGTRRETSTDGLLGEAVVGWDRELAEIPAIHRARADDSVVRRLPVGTLLLEDEQDLESGFIGAARIEPSESGEEESSP